MFRSIQTIPLFIVLFLLAGFGVASSVLGATSTATVGLGVTHDILPPTIAPELASVNTIRVFGTTVPLSTVTIQMTGTLDAGGTVTDTFTAVADSNGVWTFTTGALALGTYNFSAFTTTLIGDVSPSSGIVTQPITGTIVPPPPPPPDPTPTPTPDPGNGGGGNGGGNGNGGGGSHHGGGSGSGNNTNSNSGTISSTGGGQTTTTDTTNQNSGTTPPADSGNTTTFPINTAPPVGGITTPLSTTKKNVIQKSADTIKAVAQIIAQELQKAVKDNPGFLASAVALTAAAAAITPVVLGSAALNSIAPALYRFFDAIGRTFFGFFGAGKRRREWGIVYDGATGMPIPTAVVSLHNMQKGNVIETKVTDKYGSYYFYVLPGKYEIKVKKDGYSLPESLEHSSIKAFYKDMYLSGAIDVNKEDVLHKDIPMISDKHVKKSFAKLLAHGLGRFLARVLFYGGFAVSLYMVYKEHSWLNIALVVFYSLMLAMRYMYVGETRAGRALTMAHKPLPFVWIKVLNKSTGEREARIITDENGKYFLILNEGSYTIDASSVDNTLHVSQDITFRRRGPLNSDIILHP